MLKYNQIKKLLNIRMMYRVRDSMKERNGLEGGHLHVEKDSIYVIFIEFPWMLQARFYFFSINNIFSNFVYFFCLFSLTIKDKLHISL